MDNEPTTENHLLPEQKEALRKIVDRQIEARQNRQQRILKNLRRERSVKERSSYFVSSRYESDKIVNKIEDTEEKRKKELENDALAQDIKLKKETLDRLFYFLSGETIMIFLLAIFQGFGWLPFYLEEWSFRLLVIATITQITIMLRFAVQHLFPQRGNRKNGNN